MKTSITLRSLQHSFLIILLFCSNIILFNNYLFAQQADETMTVITTLHDKRSISTIHRVAIFFTGEDPYQVKLLQEALSIELRKVGWEIIPQLEVDLAVKNELQKANENIPDSIRMNDDKLNNWLLSKKQKILDPNNEMEVSNLLNLDAYVSGTLLLGRQQFSNQSSKINASSEKVVITTVSFQINDVKKRQTIFEAVIGYLNGKSIVFVAQDILQVLANASK